VVASPNRSSDTTKNRFLALDGLRGVAALAVLLFHITWANHFTNTSFVQNSYLAVDLFFILSGFVIYASYSNKIADFRAAIHFIWLRFFRVYPLHLAVLAAYVGLELAKLWAFHSDMHINTALVQQAPFTGTHSIPAIGANLLLIQSLGLFSDTTWNCPSWSISCEFATYILFSLGAIAGLFGSRKIIALGAILAAVGYLTLAITRGTLDVTYDWGIVRSVSGFFFGICIFKLTQETIVKHWMFSKPLVTAAEIALFIALVAALVFVSGRSAVWVIPLFIAMIAVLQLGSGAIAGLLTTRPIQFLGKISYSIYMVQFLFIDCLMIALKWGLKLPINDNVRLGTADPGISLWVGDALMIATIAAVVLVSAMTYRWIEAPCRAFGRRLAPTGHSGPSRGMVGGALNPSNP